MPIGSNTHTWDLIDQPTLAGDGVTDDSAALAAIFALVPSVGGTVVVPGLTYFIGSNLTVPPNVQLMFLNSGMLLLGNGVTLVYQGPQIIAGHVQIFGNACAGGGTVLFSQNCQVDSLFPEWWGAKGDMGVGGSSGTDSTAAIQAAFNAAVKPQSDYTVTTGVLNSGQRSFFLGQSPFSMSVRFSSRAAYRVTSTITILTTAGGDVDGNGAVIFWSGTDPTQQILKLVNCREVYLHDFMFLAHPSQPAMAAITMQHDITGNPKITPTNNRIARVTVRGNNGGFEYGIRIMMGTDGDNNDEFNDFEDVNVLDCQETGFSIEHSQSKNNIFRNCHCGGNNLNTPPTSWSMKRGVALRSLAGPNAQPQGDGSFVWQGGGGTGLSVAAFELSVPLESILIEGASFENAARLVTTQFNNVAYGLFGAAPAPASLTMTTPAGAAYQGPASVLVTSAGGTFTYPANRDTYDDLKSDGTIAHTSVANGAFEPSYAASGTRLQKVVTNATQITAVLYYGGSYVLQSYVSAPIVIIGNRVSSGTSAGIILPATGELIAVNDAGPITLIGNRIKQIGGANSPQVVTIRALRGRLAFDASKITMIGNQIVDANTSGIQPTFESRILWTNTDGSTGNMTADERLVGMNDAFSNQAINSNDITTVETAWIKQTLALVKGISSTQVPVRNTPNSVTIADPASSATVTLPTPEDDANYWVRLDVAGPIGSTANVASGSVTTTGFTIQCVPGVGQSAKVYWEIRR